MTFKGMLEPCLNNGYVRLVDYMGDDLSIIRAARVSYNADYRTGKEEGKDEALLRYLLKNKHTSPFESVTFTFEIKCPLFIARQWHRHRTWAYNEVSARYTELPEDFYVPERKHITTQSIDNKQMRTAVEHEDSEHIQLLIQDHCMESFELYRKLLKLGTPREIARSILPLATFTRFFGTVNLHNLLHFLDLRLHEHAQYEIRVYAQAIQDLIGYVVPKVVEIQYGKTA